MFNRFKTALYTAVGANDGLLIGRDGAAGDGGPDSRMPLKFPYSRPDFLQFATEEEMLVSADHSIRPIIVPRDINKLPWKSGYAETINAGKSLRNEDQATVYVGFVRKPNNEHDDSIHLNGEDPLHSIPFVYFGVFDGHAGAGASVAASNTLHKIIQEKLVAVLDLLQPPTDQFGEEKDTPKNAVANHFLPEKEVTTDSLIIGALEMSFLEMDQLIEQDRLKYRMLGGCTAVVSLFILGKLYVANAGDSRAIVCKGETAIPMSNDFTPESERHRIRMLAALKPELLGNEYTELEFCRRPFRKDIGKKMLCREAFMSGWAYKTVQPEDLRFPLVYGEGKRSRVLATIGVTRGFGDHDLKAQCSSRNIKPFLSPHPEVIIYDITNEDVTSNDVLVMGSDGLWDITSNEKAAELVHKALEHFSNCEDSRYRYRYPSAAQDLVMHSRGKLLERSWKMANGKPATIDDITVFVIPLLPYKEDHGQWVDARKFIMEATKVHHGHPVSLAEEVHES